MDILTEEATLLFLPLYQLGSTLKGKHYASLGANFFFCL